MSRILIEGSMKDLYSDLSPHGPIPVSAGADIALGIPGIDPGSVIAAAAMGNHISCI